MFRTILTGLVMLIFLERVVGQEEAELPRRAQPRIVFAQVTNDGAVTIRRPAAVSTRDRKTKQDASQPKTADTTLDERLEKFPVAEVTAYRDGLAVDEKALREFLKKPALVLASFDGEQVDPVYLRMFRNGTLVLVLPDSERQPARDKVDDLVEATIRNRHIPGLSLAIVKKGKVIKQRGYGFANVELGVAATARTVYPLTTITTTFTSIAIMMLVEEGKLSLNDKITKWIPGAPAAWDKVTVLHLLTHTSGVPDCHDQGTPFRGYIAEDRIGALRVLSALPLQAGPGEQFAFSEMNYAILGMIIEGASRITFEDFLAKRVFRPLGMNATRFGDWRQMIPARTSLYTRTQDDGLAITGPGAFPSYARPAVGLNSSAADLAKWDAIFYQGTILRQASLSLMWTPVRLNDGQSVFQRSDNVSFSYGFGWEINGRVKRPGHKRVSHMGSTNAAVAHFVEDELTVVVLTNCFGADPDSLIDKVAALYVPALGESTK